MVTLRCGIKSLGQPKVQHLHHAVFPHLDVGGFQIPMNDALLVRRFQGVCDLLGDGQRFINWNGPLLDPIGQRRTFDQREAALRLRHVEGSAENTEVGKEPGATQPQEATSPSANARHSRLRQLAKLAKLANFSVMMPETERVCSRAGSGI